jgi:hypothetical protein
MPRHGWLGVLLMLLGQVLTLVHLRPLSDWWYGISFTGVILAGDAWVQHRSGRGLLRDRPRDLVLMAVLSASAWWAVEFANLFMQAWEYSESPDIPTWRQRVRSTWFFSTLIPATWVAGMVALAMLPTRGKYRVPIAFAVGSMVLGVIGEMWNYPASPKWTYDVPVIGFWYVFEMPALGFFGYGLLALVILAVYRFVRPLVLGPAKPEGDDPLSLTGL